jgi:hypothetical protein
MVSLGPANTRAGAEVRGVTLGALPIEQVSSAGRATNSPASRPRRRPTASARSLLRARRREAAGVGNSLLSGRKQGVTSGLPTGSAGGASGSIRGRVEGFTLYRLGRRFAKLAGMPTFVLSHSHEAHECAVVAASWKGFRSPLRHGRPLGSCATGGHRMWWTVRAVDNVAALAQLPPFVAERTVVDEVREVPIP